MCSIRTVVNDSSSGSGHVHGIGVVVRRTLYSFTRLYHQYISALEKFPGATGASLVAEKDIGT